MKVDRREFLISQCDQSLVPQFPQRLAHGTFAQFGLHLNEVHRRPRAVILFTGPVCEVEQYRLLRHGTEVQAIRP